MTPEEIKAALLAFINERVYDNEQFEVTGTDLNDCMIKTVNDLYTITEESISNQDLQSVLEQGSVASIGTAFDLTAQSVRLLLSGGQGFQSTWLSGVEPNSLIVKPNDIDIKASSNTTDAYIKVTQSLIDLKSTSSTTTNAVVNINPSLGSILIGGGNANNGSIYIHGNSNINQGLGVSRNLTPPTPTATWDIDGTLKVGSLGDGSADTEVLTTDVDGNIRKKSLNSEYTYLDTADGYNLTTKANYTISNSNGVEVYIGLPIASEEMLGDWEFFLLDDQSAPTMRIVGTSYDSGNIAQRKQVILKCIKRYQIGGVTFEYAYVEVYKEL